MQPLAAKDRRAIVFGPFRHVVSRQGQQGRETKQPNGQHKNRDQDFKQRQT
jgi:hypothetical protein